VSYYIDGELCYYFRFESYRELSLQDDFERREQSLLTNAKNIVTVLRTSTRCITRRLFRNWSRPKRIRRGPFYRWLRFYRSYLLPVKIEKRVWKKAAIPFVHGRGQNPTRRYKNVVCTVRDPNDVRRPWRGERVIVSALRTKHRRKRVRRHSSNNRSRRNNFEVQTRYGRLGPKSVLFRGHNVNSTVFAVIRRYIRMLCNRVSQNYTRG